MGYMRSIPVLHMKPGKRMINVIMPVEMIEALDRLVATSRFENRSQIVRHAVTAELNREHDETAVAVVDGRVSASVKTMLAEMPDPAQAPDPDPDPEPLELPDGQGETMVDPEPAPGPVPAPQAQETGVALSLAGDAVPAVPGTPGGSWVCPMCDDGKPASELTIEEFQLHLEKCSRI